MAGEVTALKFQKRNQDRVNVYLDGEYAFALPAIDAARLHKGQFLSDQEIAELLTLDLESKAYDRAVRFLAVRPRSEWEVRQNLRRYRPRSTKGVDDGRREGGRLDDEQIDRVIERLLARGYLSDRAFARYWIEQRNRFKPMAPQALRYELRQKGVDPYVVDEIIEEETEPQEAAFQAARSRADRWYSLGQEAFQKKMAAFLQRRGFHWEIIREVVEQVWQEREQDEHR